MTTQRRWFGPMGVAQGAPATLPDFLLARIEEEETATACMLHRPTAARIREDCGARNRIVRLANPGWTDDGTPVGGGYVEAWWDTLRLLATVYADHPDYRDEWRP